MSSALGHAPPSHEQVDGYVKTALGRGVAALTLCVLGAAGMADNAHLLESGYVPAEGVHVRQEWLEVPLRVAIGHFYGDMAWLAYAKYALSQQPRMDLIAHHLLCLVGFTYMLDTPGAMLASCAMTAEVMPVTSALGALGKATGNRFLITAAPHARLASLLMWRAPLWAMIIVSSARGILQGSVGQYLAIHRMGVILGAFIVTLDAFWTWKCIKRFATGQGSAVPALARAKTTKAA